jgi:hypothetical protein
MVESERFCGLNAALAYKKTGPRAALARSGPSWDPLSEPWTRGDITRICRTCVKRPHLRCQRTRATHDARSQDCQSEAESIMGGFGVKGTSLDLTYLILFAR